MHIPALTTFFASLSLSDRAAMAVAHQCDEGDLDRLLQDDTQWMQCYIHLPRPTKAIVDRMRRAGGVLPAALIEAIAGPLRTNIESISPRTYLTIHHPLTPLEQLFVNGMVWPLMSQSGVRQWCLPGEIDRALGSARPLFEAQMPQPDADPISALALDEMLVQAACLVIDGRLLLQQHGRVSQAVLNRFNRADIPLVTFQWLTSCWIAAGVFRVDAHGLAPTQRLLEWLIMPPDERAQEMTRAWLQAAWHEWSLGGTKKRPPAFDVRYARRTFVHAVLSHIPEEWCAWAHLIDAIQMGWPDVMRPSNQQGKWQVPAGWPATWSDEDAVLIEHILRGPAQWLGLVAWDEEGRFVRRTARGGWIAGVNVPPPVVTPMPATLEQDGSVVLADPTNYYARVQLHRIADWRDDVTATISPARVRKAIATGMSSATYIDILQSVLGHPIPLSQEMLIRSWANDVAQVTVQQSLLIKTSSADVLLDITHDRQVGVPAHQSLNDTTLAIPLHEAASVIRRMRQAGYVVDVQGTSLLPFDDEELALLEQTLRTVPNLDESMRQLLHKVMQLRRKGR